MDQGALGLQELLERLGDKPLYCKLVVQRFDAKTELRSLVADSLPQVKSKSPWMHDYGDLVYVAETITGVELVKWLTDRAGALHGVDFNIQEPQETVSWTRQASYALWDPVALPLPLTRYEVNAKGGNLQAQRAGFVVGRGHSPSFMDYESAGMYFLYGQEGKRGNRALPVGLAIIRIADTTAWISRIRMSPTSLDITVDGHAAKGKRVEISSGDIKLWKTVGRRRRVHFNLPDGLPDDSLLLLSGDGTWHDYRQLGRSYGVSGALAIESAPADLPAQIRALILQGEGPTIEFKRKLPESRSEKHNVLKTIAAFATGQGGIVIFGVGEKGQRDEGELLGLTTVAGTREAMVDMIRQQVVPEPQCEVSVAELENCQIVAVQIQSSGRPCAIYPDKPEFYVRRGASTFPARYEEVEDLMQRRLLKASPRLGRMLGQE